VEMSLPKELHLEPLPDNPRRVAILWGPLVLAGDVGPEDDFPAWEPGAVPSLVAAERPVAEWLRPVPGVPGSFRSDGVGHPADVDFVPFYRLHRRTYSVYFDLFTPSEWDQQSAALAAERERQRRLDQAAVAIIQPGVDELEEEFHPQGEETWSDRARGRFCRRSRKWFSFDVPVDPDRPMALVVTYYHDEWRDRTFAILVDDQKVGQQEIPRGGVPHFFDVEYPVPEAAVRGKAAVTVRFEAGEGSETAAVYGIRMIRADAQR